MCDHNKCNHGDLNIITYDKLNSILQDKQFDLFFELCQKIKNKKPDWINVYIDSLVKKNIILGNIEFVELVYKKIYNQDIKIEYIFECIIKC